MGPSEWLQLFSGLLLFLYIWMKYHFTYWRRKNIPFIQPLPILGNLKDMILMRSCAADHMTNLYNHRNAKEQPVVGIFIFNHPALLVRDPELIKSILIKDFSKFYDRYPACDPHRDPLGSFNLFFVKEPVWRDLRRNMSPVFSSSKMKQMFPLMEEIGNELDKYLCSLPIDADSNSCIKEVRDISILYTTDVIASIAFGVHSKSLQNPDSEFKRNGQTIFDFTPYRSFEFAVMFFLPKFVRLFRCKLFTEGTKKFLRDTFNLVMAERIKSGKIRNDLIDVLVGFKNSTEANENKADFKWTNDMLVAQVATYYTAGFETTASAMSFGMFELSRNQAMQERLRKEIKEALIKNDGKITYETVNDMQYLNMFIQEVLRLYPPLPFIDRQCVLTKNEKEFSLKPFCDFGIPNGMPVYIPLYAIHRDSKYFPNPEKFDPERFSPQNKPNIIPFSYMPFGMGPHNCIGGRFGIILAKIGLVSFLRNHYVTTCEKSAKKMVLEPKALILQPKGGIHCKLVRDPLLSSKDSIE